MAIGEMDRQRGATHRRKDMMSSEKEGEVSRQRRELDI
jgi:hypothetical protein